jgi:hypothetical protein
VATGEPVEAVGVFCHRPRRLGFLGQTGTLCSMTLLALGSIIHN